MPPTDWPANPALPVHSPTPAPRRVDLHCHSVASNLASEAVLKAIKCPESYSEPLAVYDQAKRRGMDFVALTDHDSIAGALTFADRSDTIVGEELTCWFPEDRCKMHVLVWGITQSDHDALQAVANDIYQVAAYIESNRIAHAVAHPLYRQNDKLERWHVERLILLFKGFECLNGAHSALHRAAFDPLLDELSEERIAELVEEHRIAPRWPQPWIKARTAGSDDHSLLNVGRTWTEFPPDVTTVQELLQALRDGRCQPGGEAGTGVKLAHNLLGVAVRYYSRHILSKKRTRPNGTAFLIQMIVGEARKPTKLQIAQMVARSRARKLKNFCLRPFTQRERKPLLARLFLESVRARMNQFPGLRDALEHGLPPLGEHAPMFDFVSAVNRDVATGIADAIDDSVEHARFNGLFEAISAILGQQFVNLPYYFSFFHQNKERQLLRQITGYPAAPTADTLRVGLFTDTLDDINGVGRFIRDMGEQAQRKGRHFTVHTCATEARMDLPYRKNFKPMLSRRMPYYPELEMSFPPVPEILDFADQQQFDAIHISTPGPMGLVGLLVAKMLRIPVLGTYHTDFPAYVSSLTGDHRISTGTATYIKWFYNRLDTVFSRSKQYQQNLHDFGIADDLQAAISPGINTEKFHARNRDEKIWARHNVTQPLKLLYAGRVSVEKNLELLVATFQRIASKRNDVALVIAGDGPYLDTMRAALSNTPAYFLGYQNDRQLAPLYASADLFVFPSRTDTLGQVVMEAQASGLPVIVTDEGGPQETMDDGLTGLVIRSHDPADWARIIDDLLNDESRRHRMARTAPTRINRYSLDKTFDNFWHRHVQSAVPGATPKESPQTSPV